MARVEKFDLCVIGAGPAGIAAAEKGLALGRSVLVVEAVEMGGVALNWGALPAIALAASARRALDIRNAAELGIGADDPRVNFSRLNAHIKAVIGEARSETSAERLVAMGAEIIRSPAIFVGRASIEAGERRIGAKKFVLATGSRPFVPDIPGLDAIPFLTPETVFEITRRPGHLIVIGAGATGMALAQAHRRLGSAVTLIDMLEPLGDEDPELAGLVTARLEQEGVEIITNTGVVSVGGVENDIAVIVSAGGEERAIQGTHLLVATGRVSNLDTLDLGKAGVRWSRNGPAIDMLARTTNHRIYCVGDAAGTRSVHAAKFMGAWAVGHALGSRFGLALPPVLPRLIATDPEIAAVGLTEPEARVRYKDRYRVIRHGFAGLDRARARRREDGHVKVLTTPSGRVIGAGVCGEGAGEVAGIFALAIAQRLTLFDLENLVAPYPALSEIVPRMAAQYAAAHRQSPFWRSVGALKRLLP